jgi:hypothetical protein
MILLFTLRLDSVCLITLLFCYHANMQSSCQLVPKELFVCFFSIYSVLFVKVTLIFFITRLVKTSKYY